MFHWVSLGRMCPLLLLLVFHSCAPGALEVLSINVDGRLLANIVEMSVYNWPKCRDTPTTVPPGRLCDLRVLLL